MVSSPQEPLRPLVRNSISRVLVSCSEVCDALKLVELLLGFLSMTGGNPTLPLVTYLQDTLKMANTDSYILQVMTSAACVLVIISLLNLNNVQMCLFVCDPSAGSWKMHSSTLC